MDFESEVAAAREAAEAAARIIARRSQGARESWDKAEDNPVTLADLEANRAIQAALRAAFPGDAILSEETRDSPARFSCERVWIIDPLDGTKEFVQGIPEFAVSIALALQGEPVVGVVQQPLTGECFWGARGRGAWVGPERVSVVRAAPLEQSKVFSSRTEMKRGQVDPYRDWFAEIQPVGSVALKLALVAAGRAHGWISLAPKNEWDVCAGDLLIREAGGTFETWDRGVRTYNQEDLLLNPPMAAGAPGWVAALRSRDRERR